MLFTSPFILGNLSLNSMPWNTLFEHLVKAIIDAAPNNCFIPTFFIILMNGAHKET